MQESLLNRFRAAARARDLSRKTESAYLNHIRRLTEFNKMRDVSVLDSNQIGEYLEYLKTCKHFAASTQKQAACALVFLYREVFGREISSWLKSVKRTTEPAKLPVIFTPEEVKAVLSHLSGVPYLVAALMYGSGLRLNETLSLRFGDIDFSRREIIVRRVCSGVKDHTTVLPEVIVPVLQRHLIKVNFLYEDDFLRGFGLINLPDDGKRQKQPATIAEQRRQFVFPAAKLSPTANGDGFYRFHLAESTVQKAVGKAIEKAKITKKVCCQALRHSFAVRLFEKNHDLYTIRNLLGHRNLRTTIAYTNVIKLQNGVSSPLDAV